ENLKRSRLAVEPFGERDDDRPLPLGYLLERLVDRIPRGFVDLRELGRLAGPRRPFERERVASERRNVEIGFAGPGDDRFPAWLLVRAEIEKLALDRRPGLLVEFASRGPQQVLVRVGESLRDRPRAQILLRPERPARMDEHDFQARWGLTVEEDARAD